MVERYQPRLVIIACNTACTIALSHVRAALNVPVVGTVPAIKPAAETSETGVIGLLGTAATIRQVYVDALHAAHAPQFHLLRYAAPELVHAAEAKMRGEVVDPAIYTKAMAGLMDQPFGERLDVTVLGCTHFPLVEDDLLVAAPHMRFVDGATGIARRICNLTKDQSWPEKDIDGIFVTTGEVSALGSLLPALFSLGITHIQSL